MRLIDPGKDHTDSIDNETFQRLSYNTKTSTDKIISTKGWNDEFHFCRADWEKNVVKEWDIQDARFCRYILKKTQKIYTLHFS